MKKAVFLLVSSLLLGTVYGQWTTNGSHIYNSNSGNVGIGTFSPNRPLTIGGAHSANTIIPVLRLTTTGTYSSGNSMLAGTAIEFGQYHDSYPNWTLGQISSVRTGSNWGGDLLFKTNDDNSDASLTEQMRITTSGNVRIGTTSSNYKLSVATANDQGFSLRTSSSTVGGPQVDLYDAARYQETVISSTDGTNVGTYLASYSNHPLMFSTNHAAAQVTLTTGGNLGIGIISPTERLSVNGNVRAKKMIVTQTGWSDYVFNDDYKLRPLSEVAQFIKDNKHLPEIPSAKEVEEKGISVGDNQALLLKKIEELTLYLIEMQKQNERQQQQIEYQNRRIQQLENKYK